MTRKQSAIQYTGCALLGIGIGLLLLAIWIPASWLQFVLSGILLMLVGAAMAGSQMKNMEKE